MKTAGLLEDVEKLNKQAKNNSRSSSRTSSNANSHFYANRRNVCMYVFVNALNFVDVRFANYINIKFWKLDQSMYTHAYMTHNFQTKWMSFFCVWIESVEQTTTITTNSECKLYASGSSGELKWDDLKFRRKETRKMCEESHAIGLNLHNIAHFHYIFEFRFIQIKAPENKIKFKLSTISNCYI